jgi:putative transposase
MALSQSDLLRLLESLRAADGVETIRAVCERILQELIEAEATARIGAEWNEHTESRTTWRNGHREKTLTTQAGDVELAIPKIRAGSFFPSLLERRRRIDRALYAVVMEAYVLGCPPAASMTWSKPWVRTPASPRVRSRGSVPGWMRN